MSPRLLSTRPPVSVGPREERELEVGDDDAGALLGALSSDVGRDLFRHLCEEPMTTSEVAEAADTSVQNAQYHLGKLRDAGLIGVVDTWYSSKGAEMPVYAATLRRIVLDCGCDGGES